MSRRAVEVETHFDVQTIPLPSEMVSARRASLMLLLEWLMESEDADMGFDNTGDCVGSGIALISVEEIVDGN